MLAIESPYPQFFDTDGRPLNGKLWFGIANLNPRTDPVAIYWDAAGTQAAAQPVSVINGYIVRTGTPAMVFTPADYSLAIYDRRGLLIAYAPDSHEYSLGQEIAAILEALNDFKADLAAGGGSALVGFLQDGDDAVPTTVQAALRRTVHVDDFGASATPGFDNTAAFVAAKAYCAANLPITLHFGRGTYEYGETGNWAYAGLTLQGEGAFATTLQCTTATSEHTALLFNAFLSGSPSDPFIDDCNVRGMTIEGNADSLRVIRAVGISRSHWVDVWVRNGKPVVGAGFKFEGCSLNQFDGLACVNHPVLYPFDSEPQWGLYLTNGYRAGVDIGQSTNNVFTNRHMEYLPVGTFLELADNNTFVGGTDESCTVYGLVSRAGSRFNTFIGNGWENGASGGTGDVVDEGYSNAYINCYSLHKIIFQGRGCRLEGGIHKDIEVQAMAEKNIVENCTVNYPAGSVVGFTDAGTATEFNNLYDEQLAEYFYPLKPRVEITVGASPFRWENDSGQYVNVAVQAGTASQVLVYRGGVSFVASPVLPNIYPLAPTDEIQITYSVLPVMSYLPQNGS